VTPPSLSLKPTAAPPPPLSPSEAEGGYLCDRLPPPVAIDYSTPLIEELKERRKAIRNKACHNELDLDVIVEHWKWFQEQSDKLDVQCHDLSARSKRLLIRHRRGTAYSNQVAGLEKEREDYDANIRALRADKEWIEGTSAWRHIIKLTREHIVTTKSGEVFTTEELRQDEEEFGSFEEYVKRNGLR